METGLVTTNLTPTEIFVPEGLNPLITGVREKVKEFQSLNLTTERKKDRDKIKSFAMKIVKTKTYIDKARLAFVKDRKALLKIIDQEGKHFRDTLDDIKDEVRKPLTDWENAEKIRIEKERELEMFNIDHGEAIAENDIFNRERELEKKEAAIAKAEEEKRQKEEAERIAKEQKEREERIKKEAAEEAIKIAEAAAAKKIADALQKEKEAREAAEKLEQDKIEADRQEKIRVEKDKQDKIEAKQQADRDKKAAIQKAKDEFDKQAMLKKEADNREKVAIKAKADAKAADRKHQASVNNKILAGLSKVGVDEKLGKKIIEAAVRGQIEGLVVKY